jgi:hypothetical protein
MLGRCAKESEPEKAAQYEAQCRSLVAEGFHDSARLRVAREAKRLGRLPKEYIEE